MTWRARCLRLVAGLSVFAITAAGGSLASPQRAGDAWQGQQRLVERLTGWDAAAGQTVPFSRSTPAEREAAAVVLGEALATQGLVPQRHRYRLPNVNGLVDLLLPPYRGSNVYAAVPATGPGTEVVVFGAHYDSEAESPGAVDNAAGTAVVVAVARAIAGLEVRNRAFLFVFFDQEEDGEVGSRAFARHLRAEALDVHSVHTADLVGWDEDGDRAVEIQSPAAKLRPLYVDVAAALSIPLHVTRGASSDNKSFMDAGFATVAISEEWDNDDSTPHLHRPTDTVETVDFDYLASTTRLMIAVMTRLAHE